MAKPTEPKKPEPPPGWRKPVVTKGKPTRKQAHAAHAAAMRRHTWSDVPPGQRYTDHGRD